MNSSSSPNGDDAATQAGGWVGQITSNAFMKREFGKPLVESPIRRIDLSMIVDTSGAYIPGHGTPTAILIGRHRDPDNGYVHAVLGKCGEPDRPAPGSHGLVWDAIVSNPAHPGHEDDWISVELIDRDVLKSHPWAWVAAEPQHWWAPNRKPRTHSRTASR